MRTETRTLYTARELKDKFPAAFERAHEKYKENQTEILWQEEMIESLKGVFSASGLDLIDYEIDGISGPSFVRFSGLSDGARELSGKRAFAWLENNLLSGLRHQWGIAHIKSRVWHGGGVVRTTEGSDYFIRLAGTLKGCPFTGYFADDVFLESLLDDVKSGATLEDAFRGLAYKAGELRGQENDYQQTEEYFLDMADANGYEFTEDGEMI